MENHVRFHIQKGEFEVTGLLEGIDFRKPGRFGLKQVWQIMEHAKNIMFVLTGHGKAANELALRQALSAKERIVQRRFKQNC